MQITFTNRVFLFAPVWLYLILLSFFLALPSHRTELLVGSLFLLAEPHFGATFSLIFHENWRQFKLSDEGGSSEAIIVLILIPLILIGLFFLLFCIKREIAVGIFFIINIFHVTRQSSGILKILSKGKLSGLDSVFLWAGNIVCFIEIFRVIVLELENSNVFLMVFSGLTFVYCLYQLLWCNEKNKHTKIGCMITGLLMFSPIFFTKNILAVLVLGVSMHYCQYLYLTYRIVEGRGKPIHVNKKTIANSIIYCAFFIIVFSGFITYISVADSQIGLWIFIPMGFQLYHFITDAIIWKGSIKNNRENILLYIK